MHTTRKAVIPAAGTGSRLQPLTNYLPKPMLPLGRKPVLQHILQELKEAGIVKIAVIIQPEQHSFYNYFDDYPDVTFIYDKTTSGPGGAILKAEEFVAGDDFIILFSDAPVRGAERGKHLNVMMEAKIRFNAGAVVSMYRVPKEEVSSRGVIIPEDNSNSGVVPLDDFIEKPSSAGLSNSNQWASSCRYAVDNRIFDILKEIGTDSEGELQLTPAIRKMIKDNVPVLGLPLAKGLTRYDTGTFDGYFEAFSAFSEDKFL